MRIGAAAALGTLIGLLLGGCAPAGTRAPGGAQPSVAAASGQATARTHSAGAAPRGPAAVLGPRVILHPSSPSSPGATAVHFVDPQRGWAIVGCGAGQPCTLLATTDGGRTWSRQARTAARLTALQFLSPQVGFATGPTAVLATRDGGAHWGAPYAGPTPLLAITFVSARRGWAVAAGGLVRSTDGGRRWTPALRTPACTFSSLSFPAAAEGWAAGRGPAGPCLFRTADGGSSWSLSFSGAGGAPLRAAVRRWATATSGPAAAAPFHLAALRSGCATRVDFPAPADGWLSIVCDNRHYTGARLVLRTTDGGLAWRYAWGLGNCLMGCQAQAADLRPLFFLGGAQAWRLGPGGVPGAPLLTVQTTVDGGRSWATEAVNCRALGSCRHLDFLTGGNGPRGWMATPLGVFATGNGGRTWVRQWPTPWGGPFAAVAFTGARHGFGVPRYAPGTLLATSDAGSMWRPVAVFPATTPLTGVAFAGPRDGWVWGFAFGATAGLWASTDGGRRWSPRTLPGGMGDIATTHLGFSGTGGGWLIAGGRAWTTADGGRHWDPLAVTLQRGCAFLARAHGGRAWRAATCPAGATIPAAGAWAARAGALLHTADGGRSWTVRPWPGLRPAALQFPERGGGAAGWLLAQGGALWRTTDGGGTWRQVSP